MAWELVPRPVFEFSKEPLEKGIRGGKHADLD